MLDSQIGLSLILCVLTKLTGCGLVINLGSCESNFMVGFHNEQLKPNNFTIKSYIKINSWILRFFEPSVWNRDDPSGICIAQIEELQKSFSGRGSSKIHFETFA